MFYEDVLEIQYLDLYEDIELELELEDELLIDNIENNIYGIY